MQATIAPIATHASDKGVEMKQREVPAAEEFKLLTDFELLLVGGGDGAPEWGITGP